MRRLAVWLATILGVTLALHAELEALYEGFSRYDFMQRARAAGILALGYGAFVALLVGKALALTAHRALGRRLLVCLVGGGVVAPLCFLPLLLIVFGIIAGGWGVYMSLAYWLHWVRAWIVGGIAGIALAVFWPVGPRRVSQKQEAPGSAR